MPCLGLEPGQCLAPASVAWVQQLDRDGPEQDSVGRLPYLAVPAGADLLIKHVTTAEDRSRQSHRRWLPSARDSNHQTVLA